MQRIIGVVAVIIGALLAPSLISAANNEASVLKFDVMVGVTAPYTGTTNPVRGLNGGGLPWDIDEAHGKLGVDGEVKVSVEGLVLARRAPVPTNLQGTNPITSFKAIVSCQTIVDGAAVVRNVETGLFPASATGDATIKDVVALPSPCIAPVVFVTSPNGSWFSATGR
jgi:hypothetical protein